MRLIGGLGDSFSFTPAAKSVEIQESGKDSQGSSQLSFLPEMVTHLVFYLFMKAELRFMILWPLKTTS